MFSGYYEVYMYEFTSRDEVLAMNKVRVRGEALRACQGQSNQVFLCGLVFVLGGQG